jgi:hypothetical protein
MDRNPHEAGDLEALGRRLRNDRPQASPVELDRMKRRVISQASASTGNWALKKGLFMKPRIAVAFILAMGLLTSGTGATLAVISESGSAAQVQYPDLGPTGESAPDRLGGDTPTGSSTSIQEEEQVASSGGGELPFTGFLAIPLLIVGVVFLVAGGVMRSRTGRDAAG